MLRRSFGGQTLLLSLMQSLRILSITSDALSKLLHMHGMAMRKNATKTCKIKALLKLEQVQQQLPSEIRERIEKLLAEADEKRQQKKSLTANGENAEDEEDLEEVAGLQSLR